jgi:hypothetical protein
MEHKCISCGIQLKLYEPGYLYIYTNTGLDFQVTLY